MMVERPDDLVELYRAKGLPEAHALVIALDGEGISSRIDNEYLQGAVGELPLGWATSPRILVLRADESQARALLLSFLQHAQSVGSRNKSRHPNPCLVCGMEMGSLTECPACQWSYEPGAASGETASDADSVEERESQASADTATLPPIDRSIWWEVAAVSAVGVVPNLLSAITALAHPQPPQPYWVDTVQLTGTSLCTIFVTLYLIHRSGTPWADFGIVRPRISDLFLAVGLYFLAFYLWASTSWLMVESGRTASDPFTYPRTRIEYGMMVLKYLASATAEEVVTRAYLVTRLTTLLRSRGEAVVFAAAAFGSYHIYWGLDGAIQCFLFGLLFGIAFLLIRRLWPLALAHAVYNMLNEWNV